MTLRPTREEFRQLATQHHDLDEKIHHLSAKNYLSEPEQLEEVRLKKRKLQIKDSIVMLQMQLTPDVPA